MFVIGLAGPAEGAVGFELALSFLSLMITGGIAIPGIWMRSRRLAFWATFLFIAVTLILWPWYGFIPMESDDPDMQTFIRSARMNAFIWLFIAMATIASFVRSSRVSMLDAEEIRYLD